MKPALHIVYCGDRAGWRPDDDERGSSTLWASSRERQSSLPPLSFEVSARNLPARLFFFGAVRTRFVRTTYLEQNSGVFHGFHLGTRLDLWLNRLVNESHLEFYGRLQTFVGFDEQDQRQLAAVAPILLPEQERITDQFYEAILREPETAAYVEGRLDGLKRTHGRWFRELFGGDYGPRYFENRWRIGMAHVRIGLHPRWVDLVLTHVHEQVLITLKSKMGDDGVSAHQSVARLIELDRAVIQLAYDEDRLDRLTEFTGMKRTLIENVVRIARG